jgi:hypothetical protein
MAYQDTVAKLTYSTEARTVLSASMSNDRYETAGFSNSGTAGYVGGGYGTAYGSNQGLLQSIDKFTFSNDSRSTLSATITMGGNFGRYGCMGFANSGTAGYVAGGGFMPRTDIIDKITFSNDSKSTLSATLSGSTWDHGAGWENKNTAGYVGGGAAHTDTTAIDKLAYSNESVSTLTATLSVQRERCAGLGNGGTY